MMVATLRKTNTRKHVIVMASYDYRPPVSKLLELGERPLRRNKPHDYRAMGIAEEHLAELSRMSRDRALFEEDCPDPARWAPIHAARAMIQLKTTAAIEPLVKLLDYPTDADFDDACEWYFEDVPEGLVSIGSEALPAIGGLLQNEHLLMYSRIAAADALAKMGERHPKTRGECVRLLVASLDRFGQNEPELNGWLIANLIRLKGVEAAASIERAFTSDRVDETIAGDWDEVKASLGLRPPLSDSELAAKLQKRHAAHGWLSPEDMLAQAKRDYPHEKPWDEP
jgi:uncharacterized protein DUF1186